MIFTKDQIKILKNFSGSFNSNLLITQNKETNKTDFFSITYDKSAIALYSTEKIDDIKSNLQLYNAAEFVNLIQTFINYDLTINKDYINIKNIDNGSKIKYSNIADEFDAIYENYQNAINLLKSNDKPLAEFVLDVNIFNDIKKVSSILKLTDIIINFDKKSKSINLSVCVSNIYDNYQNDELNDLTPKNDNFDIIIDSASIIKTPTTTDKKVLDIESIRKLIQDTYKIKIFDKFIIFENKNNENQLIYVFSYYN